LIHDTEKDNKRGAGQLIVSGVVGLSAQREVSIPSSAAMSLLIELHNQTELLNVNSIYKLALVRVSFHIHGRLFDKSVHDRPGNHGL